MPRSGLEFVAAIVLSLGAIVSLTLPANANDVMVMNAFARAPAVSTAQAIAVYFSVMNHSDQPDRLIRASSDISGHAQLHSSTEESGVMKMRPVEGLDVPAHGEVALSPGGYHLMLTGLKRPLRPADEFSLTLTFERAGKVTVEVLVGKVGQMEADHSHTGAPGE